MRAGWYNDDDDYGDNGGDVDGDGDTDHDSNKRNVLFCTVCTVWSVFSFAIVTLIIRWHK